MPFFKSDQITETGNPVTWERVITDQEGVEVVRGRPTPFILSLSRQFDLLSSILLRYSIKKRKIPAWQSSHLYAESS
jgi:hypothetical protein